MHLDLECVESFLVLVEEGHYAHAAARLHVSASALTKRVQRLERYLGVVLIERHPSDGFVLTSAGERLAADAGALLVHEHKVRRAVRDPRVTVVLGVPHDGGTQSITPAELVGVRRRLQHEHPDAVLICRRTPLPAMTTWLLDGLGGRPADRLSGPPRTHRLHPGGSRAARGRRRGGQ